MQFFACIFLYLGEENFRYMDKRKTLEKLQDIIKSEFNEDEQKGMDAFLTIKPKTRPSLAPNIMVFQTFAYLASTELKPSSNKVLMYLFSMSAYENFLGIDIKTLSEKLSMSERSVISALNELEDNGVIAKVKSGTDRRRNDYFINPMSAWKGNSTARKMKLDIIEDEDPNQLHLFGETLADARKREKSEVRNKKSTIQLLEEKIK